MGNTSTKKKYAIPASHYGGIFVKLDKESFFPGETLTGNVYLNLQNVYPGSKLILSFKGEELASWVDAVSSSSTDSDGNSTSTTSYYTREQKVKIFKQERDLYNLGQGMSFSAGQYVFPFQFMIPEGLPGSFFYTRIADDLVAEIKYMVTAYLQPSSDSTAKLKNKMGMVIREYPKTAIQAKEAVIQQNVDSCCCIDKGTISIRTVSEKNAYAPLEQVRLTAEIDNSRCSAAISNVRFYLLQKIHLKAEAYTNNIEIPIYKVDLGGMTPGQKCVGNEAKTVNIQLPPGQPGTAKNVERTKSKQKNIPVRANPAEFIAPSATGQIVKSEFSLKVECKTDAVCMKPPNAELPIFVYAPVPVKMPDPVPPMNWYPQQHTPVNLAFNVPSVNQDPYQGQYQNVNQPYQQVPMTNNNINMNGYNQPQRI